MNRRRHVQHLLSVYIDGDLSPAGARAVAAHLEECPGCARELEQWRAVLRLVSQHGAVLCPIDCAEAVLRRLQAHPSCGPPRRRVAARAGSLIPALALILTIGGGGTWLWATRDAGRSGTGGAAPIAAAGGDAPAFPSLTGAAPDSRDGSAALAPDGILPQLAGAYSVRPVVVPVHAPVRLEEAFGRSDSLILAADFAEDDR